LVVSCSGKFKFTTAASDSGVRIMLDSKVLFVLFGVVQQLLTGRSRRLQSVSKLLAASIFTDRPI